MSDKAKQWLEMAKKIFDRYEFEAVLETMLHFDLITYEEHTDYLTITPIKQKQVKKEVAEFGSLASYDILTGECVVGDFKMEAKTNSDLNKFLEKLEELSE